MFSSGLSNKPVSAAVKQVLKFDSKFKFELHKWLLRSINKLDRLSSDCLGRYSPPNLVTFLS